MYEVTNHVTSLATVASARQNSQQIVFRTQDVEMEYEMSWQTLRHRLACLDGPGAWLSSSLL